MFRAFKKLYQRELPIEQSKERRKRQRGRGREGEIMGGGDLERECNKIIVNDDPEPGRNSIR